MNITTERLQAIALGKNYRVSTGEIEAMALMLLNGRPEQQLMSDISLLPENVSFEHAEMVMNDIEVQFNLYLEAPSEERAVILTQIVMNKTLAAVRAHIGAAVSVTLSDGWLVVPVKPTKEMLSKVHPITEATCPDCDRLVTADCEENVLLSWDDMLDAAPKPATLIPEGG